MVTMSAVKHWILNTCMASLHNRVICHERVICLAFLNRVFSYSIVNGNHGCRQTRVSDVYMCTCKYVY